MSLIKQIELNIAYSKIVNGGISHLNEKQKLKRETKHYITIWSYFHIVTKI